MRHPGRSLLWTSATDNDSNKSFAIGIAVFLGVGVFVIVLLACCCSQAKNGKKRAGSSATVATETTSNTRGVDHGPERNPNNTGDGNYASLNGVGPQSAARDIEMA